MCLSAAATVEFVLFMNPHCLLQYSAQMLFDGIQIYNSKNGISVIATALRNAWSYII